MSRILTLETLKSKKACNEQVELFQKMFGDSVEITPELCIKHAKYFYFNWAAKNLLSNAALNKYNAEKNAAWEKYDAERNAASDKYHAEENAAWEKYDAERNAAYDKYNAEKNAALDKYHVEENAAWEKYRDERASIFANAYINDVEQ